MNVETLYVLGFALMFCGTLIILAAILLLFYSNAKKEGKTKGGGILIIGPLPIVFGTDKEIVKKVPIISILLTILLTVAAIIMYLMSR